MPQAMLIMAILLFSYRRQEMLSTPIRFVWVPPGWKCRKLNFLTCREGEKNPTVQHRRWLLVWDKNNVIKKESPWYSSSLLYGHLAFIHVEIMNGFFFFFEILFIQERGENVLAQEWGWGAEEEAGSLLSLEPNTGLHPRPWRSGPEPKADA